MNARAVLTMAAAVGTMVAALRMEASPCDGMAMIPAGPFHMGDPSGQGGADERPVHSVDVDAFQIDRCEMSNARAAELLNWALSNGLVRVSGGTASTLTDPPRALLQLSDWNSELAFDGRRMAPLRGREAFPCVEVTWFGAAALCNVRSLKEGLEPCYRLDDWSCDYSRNGYRLPTEAEWEKAARGGLAGAHYPWGGTNRYEEAAAGSMANFWGSGDAFEDQPASRATPVGYYDGTQRPDGRDMANGYGLYDMAGNVWEWCHDWYSADGYATTDAGTKNTCGPSQGTERVRRGGSWVNGQKEEAREGVVGDGWRARNLRCAERAASDPTRGSWNCGFRCVRR